MLAEARVGARAAKASATARAGKERNMAERAGRIPIIIAMADAPRWVRNLR